MKKFIAPIVLLVLSLALVVYLSGAAFGTKSSFDPQAYLTARAQIDSLEIALWEAQNDPAAQQSIRSELEQSWESLTAMRNANAAKEVSPEEAANTNPVLDPEVLPWVVGGSVAVIICIIALVFILKRRKEYLTRQMETLKTESVTDSVSSEDTLPPPVVRPKKRSIIAEAEDYAAKKRETMAQQAQPKEAQPESSVEAPVQQVAFEDEHGVPENKILTGAPGSKPTLRPTARERITSAMRNLSEVLRAPRGLSRERTMKIRAQSHNLTGDPNLAGSNPLETSRFDREATEKVRVLQLSRRGLPASAIASALKLPQDKVESIIKEAQG